MPGRNRDKPEEMNQNVLLAESSLRRNYDALQFCPQNNREDLGKSASHSLGKLRDMFPGFRLIPMRGQASTGLSFMEQLMLPHELGKLDDAYLVFNQGHKDSAAINLDEHLVLKARGNHQEIPDLISHINQLEKSMADRDFPYAFDAQYGYLSYRPFLAGSGLYLTLLMHLPLLHYLKQIRPLTQALKEEGLFLRPVFAPDARNPARLFLLSNVSSLNKSEEEIKGLVVQCASNLSQKEGEMRQKAMNGSAHSMVLDQVWRSYGILKYARRLSANDFLTHWSGLRLGASSGILPIDLNQADSLLIYGNDQPFKNEGALPSTYIFQRADAVRQALSGG